MVGIKSYLSPRTIEIQWVVNKALKFKHREDNILTYYTKVSEINEFYENLDAYF